MCLEDEAPVAVHLYSMYSGGRMIRDIQDVSTALEGTVADLAPSLVSIISHRIQVSGFVWRAGLIVTSDEGLADEGEVRVMMRGGDSTVAHPVGRDPSTAIALLKVERPDLQPIAMAATIPSTGALVIALGAEDSAPTAASGWSLSAGDLAVDARWRNRRARGA
jgi:S1-C subfamily serine protease